LTLNKYMIKETNHSCVRN